MNKWYMQNPAPVLKNDTHKLLWDFDIHTDHLISARRPDLIIINKKKKRICKIVDFAVPADYRIKLKECEKKDKYLNLARELKKLWNMKVTIVTCCHSDSSEKPSPNTDVKNSKGVTCKIVDFAVPADHRIKLKECEK